MRRSVAKRILQLNIGVFPRHPRRVRSRFTAVEEGIDRRELTVSRIENKAWRRGKGGEKRVGKVDVSHPMSELGSKSTPVRAQLSVTLTAKTGHVARCRGRAKWQRSSSSRARHGASTTHHSTQTQITSIIIYQYKFLYYSISLRQVSLPLPVPGITRYSGVLKDPRAISNHLTF